MDWWNEQAEGLQGRSDLGDIYRSSYGIGLRMVSGSGFVYRAGYATGDEGGTSTWSSPIRSNPHHGRRLTPPPGLV